MKKRLLPALFFITIVFFSGKPRTILAPPHPAAASANKTVPVCGPFMTIENPSGYTVSHLTVLVDGTSISDVISPTFPYGVPGPLPHGTYTIKVIFSGVTFGGSMNVQDGDGVTYDCETFDTHSCTVVFWGSCLLYTINITNVTTCDPGLAPHTR